MIIHKILKFPLEQCKRMYCRTSKKPPWKVLFFGSDAFSVFSLKALTAEYRKGRLLTRLEVVTSIKGKFNAVKKLSEAENLCLHQWPPDFKCGEFDIGLVVSFGHLIPVSIIENGMLNVHASLLPRWRGAAPIIYTIANGDTQTGTTIMQIKPHKFDIGRIVHQQTIRIPPDIKISDLYTTLGTMGATNLVKVLELLAENLERAKSQPTEGVTYAPKVTIAFACIKWNTMTSQQICNLERSLEGTFHLQTTWHGITVKLIRIKQGTDCDKLQPGFVEYDRQNERLKVACVDFKYIEVDKVGVTGKKVMSALDFINGYVKKQPPDCMYFT